MKKPISRAPNITYTYAKVKGIGYGVYVMSLSGQALADLSSLIKGVSLDLDEKSETFGKILFNGVPLSGALRVNSTRLIKASSEDHAKRLIQMLKSQPELKQIARLAKVRIWPVTKDKVLVKAKYYKFSREVMGKSFPIFSSQDKGKVQYLVDAHKRDGIRADMEPTVNRTKVLSLTDVQGEYWDPVNKKIIEPRTNGMDISAYNVPGYKGMCAPKQGSDAVQRIVGKRKRTTTVNFHNRWR